MHLDGLHKEYDCLFTNFIKYLIRAAFTMIVIRILIVKVIQYSIAVPVRYEFRFEFDNSELCQRYFVFFFC